MTNDDPRAEHPATTSTTPPSITTTDAAHLVDDRGRVLIEPSWPSDRAAPGELELVRRFCNSINRESGADHFAEPRGFDRWLAAEGQKPTNPSLGQLATVLAARGALHDIVTQGRADASEGWAALAVCLTNTTFRLRAEADSIALCASSPSPTEDFLGEIALILVRCREAGTLRRLIACASCEWMIYDASKNRSARWCSASVCGGRHNARNYRRRQRESQG